MTDNPYRSLAEALKTDWRVKARPNQLAPKGEWAIWLLLAGRGFGKTRVLSEWVIDQVKCGVKRIAIVGATAADCRDVIVEGESGIMACARDKPQYEPSKRRVTWGNGAVAHLYSADEPDRLRGPQHDAAICDELAAWRYPEAWDMLMFTLRLGKNPRCVVATTPKPTKLIKSLVAREGQDVVITRGSTRENKDNLAPQFLRTIVKRFEGTRLGRQELDGELLLDTPGALWSNSNLEDTRVQVCPPLQRIVIAVDPSGSGGENADEAGIMVAGIGHDQQGYILADYSGRMDPIEWARTAVRLYHEYKADRIIAETNYGGQIVIATIAAVDANVPTKSITSSRGKALRAEPVAALFEQRRAHLVGAFPVLEDQMTSFTVDYDRNRDGSPDRVDALVFALTELLLGHPLGGYFSTSSLLVNGEPVDPYPRGMTNIFAVASVPSKSAETVGVVYVGVDDHRVTPTPFLILGYDITPTDDNLLQSWLPNVHTRLAAYAERFDTPHAGLWLHATSGVPAALYEQSNARGNIVHNIDDKVNWANAPLADRAAAASRHIHPGKRVKISREAHEHMVQLNGVNRNHLLAEFTSFRLDEDTLDDGLLRALLSAVRIALDNGHGAYETPDPPPPPIPAPPPPPLGKWLSPGRHTLDGIEFSVPSTTDQDLTFVPITAGRHLLDSKITFIR